MGSVQPEGPVQAVDAAGKGRNRKTNGVGRRKRIMSEREFDDEYRYDRQFLPAVGPDPEDESEQAKRY